MTKKHKGFTLIELLVVIAIIGILSTISTVSLQSARGKARDASRHANMAQVQLALELYFDDNMTYPVTDNMDEADRVENYNTILMPELSGDAPSGETYMLRPPIDPFNRDPFFYGYNSDGLKYVLTYVLEDGTMVHIYGN